MGDLFSGLLNTPVPTSLVLGGLVFIFLGLGGKITTAQIPPATRKYFSIAGTIFVLIGAVLFAIPQENNKLDESTANTGTLMPSPDNLNTAT